MPYPGCISILGWSIWQQFVHGLFLWYALHLVHLGRHARWSISKGIWWHIKGVTVLAASSNRQYQSKHDSMNDTCGACIN